MHDWCVCNTRMANKSTFFATCAPGLADVLHGEARALKLPNLERQVGGVLFQGSMREAWLANLQLRTAVRVLLRLERFEALTAEDLYRHAQKIDWSEYLIPEGSFFVDAQCRDSQLDHSQFVAQKVKDAVVDQFRQQTGARPIVDKDQADLRIHVHLWKDRCTISVDTSGDSLHKRGYRKYQGQAPLAETLAAAIVLCSGWDLRSPVVDPFCGSGTVLIEAALIAAKIPPGSFRRFGFENWLDHDSRAYESLRDRQMSAIQIPSKLRLLGRDRDPQCCPGAIRNAESAGVAEIIDFETGDFSDFRPRPGWNAWILSNLPYGVRVGDPLKLENWHRELGNRLRKECSGYHLALLSGSRSYAHALGLQDWKVQKIRNGALRCELILAKLP
jgi:23S rRNA (guanine2445-N2)-methyltransferase